MGWDISYHPISEEQINSWYFDVLENNQLIESLATEHEMDEFYQDKYQETINAGLNTDSDDIFDKSHGYYIAVVQGFFQKYFYTRGAALSFSENSLLDKYFKTWQQFIPQQKLTEHVENTIIENYCSGVFIPKDKVVELLDNYQIDSDLKKELDDLFSHGRIDVFLQALTFAKENSLGLLEATEVVEPNPMDLDNSTCYSNLFNCDIAGPLLYHKAAMEQIAEFEAQENLQAGEVSSNATYVTNHIETDEPKQKKSFWKKLFGK